MTKWTDKPWERQKGESEKAFGAFAAYRDMGPERTISAVVKKLGKSRTLIDRWKERWDWQERVRAYDNELEKEARAKAVQGRKDMTERHIKIAMQVQKKALEALASLSVEDMSPKDIKEYIKMATDLERLNRMFEEQSSNGDSDAPTQLADTIVAAYQKRKEEGNA
ncbi:MAG TPA: hypothetical protein H9942_00520 [Candidatus Acutalibacter ornithocaccae]|uniref:Terminase small subunit n=1 Tax=Candidatus Acutalibacter ornithocaccae TaxID=2838416 RepID=A0A9D2LWE8_9FIRM|nr:hypothetical protein [Candidatus Acutalibacter ornithocaccae]